MLKDFDISSFKNKKPPNDNGFDTDQEIKALKKIPLRKKFVKDNDNIEEAFKKTAEQNNVEDYGAPKKHNRITQSLDKRLSTHKLYGGASELILSQQSLRIHEW